MFSREDVASFIQRSFEPAWEMVRPVPIVRIDFGNGHVATRTLHGNIASYVCGTDGNVVDILPGIYTPAAYQAALEPLRQLALEMGPFSQSDRQAQLQAYHRTRQTALNSAAQPAQANPNDLGKRRMELRVEQLVSQPVNPVNATAPPARPRPGTNLADWEPLAVDTRQNEQERRLQIHTRLATSNLLRPDQIKTWLYREVLHADLEDPYLGLGNPLFGDDVFREVEG